MIRRDALALLSALPLFAAGAARANLSEADMAAVRSVQNYFNRIAAAEGRFTQKNPNGSASRGRYYLQRPGKFRFEYEGSNALVLSDGGRVAVFDAKSNTGPQIYPLGTTPLRLLVASRVDLTEPGVATAVDNDGTFTSVTLQDPRRPRDGSITLTFQNVPPTLVRWAVRERSGRVTTVAVESITLRDSLRTSLFNIRRAEDERG